MTTSMKCPSCGLMQLVRETCKSCGTALGSSAPQTATSPPAPNQEESAASVASLQVPKEIGGKISNAEVIDFVTKSMEQDEEILATAVGLRGDFLLVTNKKVSIIKYGIAAWATGGVGLKTKSFVLSHIASMDVNKRWVSCDLEIVSGGMVEKSRGGLLAAAVSENIFQFEQPKYDAMLSLVNDIKGLISSSKSPSPVQPTISDIPSQIEKLAGLKEKGIISQEEFEAKKQDLLSRM